MGGPGRSEDLAGKAVLEFDQLAFDYHLLGAGWRSVCARRVRVGHLWEKIKRHEL